VIHDLRQKYNDRWVAHLLYNKAYEITRECDRKAEAEANEKHSA
jgi:hypothetical protein